MAERLRVLWGRTVGMRLALWLNKKHPDWCWADLCTDVGLGWDVFNWRRAKNSNMCKRDLAANGVCWCGKMRKDKKNGEKQ